MGAGPGTGCPPMGAGPGRDLLLRELDLEQDLFPWEQDLERDIFPWEQDLERDLFPWEQDPEWESRKGSSLLGADSASIPKRSCYMTACAHFNFSSRAKFVRFLGNII